MVGSTWPDLGARGDVAAAGALLRSIPVASNGVRAVLASRRWQAGVLLRHSGSCFVASTKSLPASDVPVVFP